MFYFAALAADPDVLNVFTICNKADVCQRLLVLLWFSLIKLMQLLTVGTTGSQMLII